MGYDRFYEVDGKKYVSVTTILGIISKGKGFENWLRKNTEAESNKLSQEAIEIGSILHDLIDKWHEGAMFDSALKISDRITEFMKIKYSDKPSELDMVKVLPIVELGFKRYCDLWKLRKCELVETEITVYNNACEYAGTLDRVVKIEGVDGLVLQDLKTSNGIWEDYWLQVAAYEKAYGSDCAFEILRIDKKTLNIEIADYMPNGDIKRSSYNGEELKELKIKKSVPKSVLFDLFMCALKLWNWKNYKGE